MLHRALSAFLAVAIASAPALAEDTKPAAEPKPATPAPAAQPAQPRIAAPRPAVTLKPGDPAPAISFGTWLKGEPVTELKKGNTYIIECWATWCGPCITAIPHVTELQAKYKDKGLIVLGVDVWERAGTDDAKVKAFVENQGDKMNYRVVRDDLSKEGAEKGVFATTWLAAAGQNGIPCSFIVDKEGTIAWIGHPMRLDSVLPKVLAGTFDVKKEAELDAKMKELQTAYSALLRAKDFDGALKNLDERAALRPEESDMIELTRLQLLIGSKHDFTAGNALAAKLIDGPFKENARYLSYIGVVLSRPITGETPAKDPRDLSLALKAAQRANELTKGADASALNALAGVHFERGEIDKAIEFQTKVVEMVPENAKAYQNRTLEKYKAAKSE